jgi:hypothetical protein
MLHIVMSLTGDPIGIIVDRKMFIGLGPMLQNFFRP